MIRITMPGFTSTRQRTPQRRPGLIQLGTKATVLRRDRHRRTATHTAPTRKATTLLNSMVNEEDTVPVLDTTKALQDMEVATAVHLQVSMDPRNVGTVVRVRMALQDVGTVVHHQVHMVLQEEAMEAVHSRSKSSSSHPSHNPPFLRSTA